MKKLYKKIAALVCSIGLLAATTTTNAVTTMPAEPIADEPAYCLVCIDICGYLHAFAFQTCLSNERYDALEAQLNANC
jgi:hypothetical protein